VSARLTASTEALESKIKTVSESFTEKLRSSSETLDTRLEHIQAQHREGNAGLSERFDSEYTERQVRCTPQRTTVCTLQSRPGRRPAWVRA
jgi:hypothetical protein